MPVSVPAETADCSAMPEELVTTPSVTPVATWTGCVNQGMAGATAPCHCTWTGICPGVPTSA
jgi:hypothetical protein